MICQERIFGLDDQEPDKYVLVEVNEENDDSEAPQLVNCHEEDHENNGLNYQGYGGYSNSSGEHEANLDIQNGSGDSGANPPRQVKGGRVLRLGHCSREWWELSAV